VMSEAWSDTPEPDPALDLRHNAVFSCIARTGNCGLPR
jgi:hypothetical protein